MVENDRKNEEIEMESTHESCDCETEDSRESMDAEGESQGGPSSDTEEASSSLESMSKEDLIHRLQQAEAEVERVNGAYLRSLADYDNARKRMAAERRELRQLAICELIADLLPTIDNLERAMEVSPDSDLDSVLKGVKMTYRQIMQVLEKENVHCIDALGKSFDPNLHEAVGREESGEHEENTVIDEVQKGYKTDSRVIRPSMVRVSKLP